MYALCLGLMLAHAAPAPATHSDAGMSVVSLTDASPDGVLTTLADALGGAGLAFLWMPDDESDVASVWDVWDAARTAELPVVIVLPDARTAATLTASPELTSRALWPELRKRVYWAEDAGAFDRVVDGAVASLLAVDAHGQAVLIAEGAASETVAELAAALRQEHTVERDIQVVSLPDELVRSGEAFLTVDGRRETTPIELEAVPRDGGVMFRGHGPISGRAEQVFLWAKGCAPGIPLDVAPGIAASAAPWVLDVSHAKTSQLTVEGALPIHGGRLLLHPEGDPEWTCSAGLAPGRDSTVFEFVRPGQYVLSLEVLGGVVGRVRVTVGQDATTVPVTDGALRLRDVTVALEGVVGDPTAGFTAWAQFESADDGMWSEALSAPLTPVSDLRSEAELWAPLSRPCRVGLRMDNGPELATQDVPAGSEDPVVLFETVSVLAQQEGSIRALPRDERGKVAAGGGIALAPDGSARVSDRQDGRILVVRTEAGDPPLLWAGAGGLPGQLASPAGLAVSDELVTYVADSGNDRIQAFDHWGRFSRSFGQSGRSPGRLRGPSDVAIGADGSIFVADTGNDRVQVYDPNGLFVAAWGESGREPGQLSGPSSIAIARSGEVYVCDSGGHRVQSFDPSGALLQVWGEAGDGPGELRDPQGIALDQRGGLWIADTGNERIQILRPGTPPQVLDTTRWGISEPIDLAVMGNGRRAWVLSRDGSVFVIDVPGGPHR